MVFHFNKKHLEDPSVPMWIIKTHGITFYVNHVIANIPFSTKETPNNSHTKGSIKFAKCKLSFDEDNNAYLDPLGLLDLNLSHPKETTRIIARDSGTFHEALEAGEFKHSEFKFIEGSCSTEFVICDLLDKDEALIAAIKYANQFRILSPNERYYIAYETGKGLYSYYDELEDDYDLDN